MVHLLCRQNLQHAFIATEGGEGGFMFDLGGISVQFPGNICKDWWDF
jgi:hypothetical protein